MASEITVSVNASVAKNNQKLLSSKQKTNDMSGSLMASFNQSFTTSGAAVAPPSGISTNTSIVITNNDSTNFVQVWQDSGFTKQMSKLLPGQFCLLTGIAALPYVNADTATCSCGIDIWQV